MPAKMICSDDENVNAAEKNSLHKNSSKSKEVPCVPLVRLVTVTEENIKLFKVL